MGRLTGSAVIRNYVCVNPAAGATWIILAAVMLLPCAFADTPKAKVPAEQVVTPEAAAQAQAAYTAGYKALTAQDVVTARREFEAVVRLTPSAPEGHNALGFVLLETGHAAEAAAQFEKALALGPTAASARATRESLALAYAGMREDKKSLATLEAMWARGPLSPVAAVLAARLLSAAGRDEDAIRELRRSAAAAGADTGGSDKGAMPAPARAELAQVADALGTLLAQKQQWAEAQQQFESAIALDDGLAGPQLAVPQLHLGTLFMVQSKFDEALPHLEKAAELAPADAMAEMQLGKDFTALHRDAEALAALRKAELLTQAAGTAANVRLEAEYQLALALQNSTKPGDAIPYFEKVVEAEPDRVEALVNLGLAMVQTGKPKEATAYYLRAQKLDANNVTLHTGLGVDYLQQSDLDGAVTQFRAGLALDPQNAMLHYDLGLALKLKDQLNLAVPELEKALELDPTMIDPHVTLGTLYMQQGKFDAAAVEMRAVLEAQPDNGDMWATLGSVYKQAGKNAEAIDALHKAIQLMPNQPGPHTTLASILQEQGSTEEAAAERKQAAALTRGAMNKQAALFATNAGDLLLSKGQMDEAIAQYRTAIKDDAGYAPAHRQLAIALEQKGQKTEAAAERKVADQLEAAAKADAAKP